MSGERILSVTGERALPKHPGHKEGISCRVDPFSLTSCNLIEHALHGLLLCLIALTPPALALLTIQVLSGV
jgi:hypothetical protein